MINLSTMVEVQVAALAAAAGTSTITSDAIDLQAFDACMFLVPFGTITAGAVTSFKIQQSSDDGVTDGYSDLAGSSVTVADTQSGKVAYIDVVRPTKRYLKLVISRATQNSVVNNVLALKYIGHKQPVTQGATVMTASEISVSPAEGTA